MMMAAGSAHYNVASMIMNLRDGSNIQYSSRERKYSLSSGTMACHSWISGNKTATFSDSHQVDINNMSLKDITVNGGEEGFCGEASTIPVVTWGGDFTMNILGSLMMSAGENGYIHAGTSLVIGGGTKGIYIDSTGSSATTL